MVDTKVQITFTHATFSSGSSETSTHPVAFQCDLVPRLVWCFDTHGWGYSIWSFIIAECVQRTLSVPDYLFIYLFVIKSIHRYSHEEPSTRNWILGTNFSYSSSSSKNCIIMKHARNNYKYCRLKKSTSIAWTQKVTNYWKETKSIHRLE